MSETIHNIWYVERTKMRRYDAVDRNSYLAIKHMSALISLAILDPERDPHLWPGLFRVKFRFIAALPLGPVQGPVGSGDQGINVFLYGRPLPTDKTGDADT